MRIIILITATLICSPVISQQENQAGAEYGQGQDNSNNEITVRSESLSAIEDSIDSIAANTTPDDRAQNHQERTDRINTGLARLDLHAQNSMADSTYIIMLFTGIAIFLTLVGLWMLGRTLHWTKKAAYYADKTLQEASRTADAAIKSNDAARESASISRETMIRDLRAYILMNTPTFEYGGGDTFRFKTPFTNYGKTPAYATLLEFTTFVAEYPIPPVKASEYDPFQRERRRISFGSSPPVNSPTNSVFIDSFALTQPEKDMIANNTGAYFLGGIMHYKDVFKKDRWARFLYLVKPDSDIFIKANIWNDCDTDA